MRFEVEVVTPLFLGGAEVRGAPELRAASIRGALRFWLRALLGGVIGDKDLNGLRRAEAAVFGSTDTGASPVVVRVAGNVKHGSYPPLLHNPKKSFFHFKGIKPSETFSLELNPRRPSTKLSPIVLSITALWLLLGGAGKRSRRGFGTLQLKEGMEGFPFTSEVYSNADEFQNTLKRVIKEAKTEAQNHTKTLGIASGTPGTPPAFPLLHDDHTKILLCKHSFAKWEEAMKAFWGLLRSDTYQDDPVFGFAGSGGRQASLLHLRILKIDKWYHLLMTAFRSDFKSRSHSRSRPQDFRGGGAGRERRDQDSSWSRLQDFLQDCDHRWGGIWIMGGSTKW